MDWCRARFAATCCRWRHCQPELTARFLRQIPHAKVVDVSRAAHMVAGDQNDALLGRGDRVPRARRAPAPGRATVGARWIGERSLLAS